MRFGYSVISEKVASIILMLRSEVIESIFLVSTGKIWFVKAIVPFWTSISTLELSTNSSTSKISMSSSMTTFCIDGKRAWKSTLPAIGLRTVIVLSTALYSKEK